MSKLYRDNFEAFVLSNSVLFYSFAKRYITKRHIAEDILQDCYVKLWNNIDKLEHVADAKLYLFAMIKNAALNYNQREQRTELTDNIEEHINPENHLEFSEEFINEIFEEEANTMLAKAISSLPKNQRTVMLLSLKGYTNPQIATILEATEDSVKSRKKRALQKLIQSNIPKIYLLLFL